MPCSYDILRLQRRDQFDVNRTVIVFSSINCLPLLIVPIHPFGRRGAEPCPALGSVSRLVRRARGTSAPAPASRAKSLPASVQHSHLLRVLHPHARRASHRCIPQRAPNRAQRWQPRRLPRLMILYPPLSNHSPFRYPLHFASCSLTCLLFARSPLQKIVQHLRIGYVVRATAILFESHTPYRTCHPHRRIVNLRDDRGRHRLGIYVLVC